MTRGLDELDAIRRRVMNVVGHALRTPVTTMVGLANALQASADEATRAMLIDGLVRMMDSPDDITGPINLGNPVEFTMRQLAELVIAKVGGSSSLVHAPLPTDDPRQRQPNIGKARELLGWEPRVALADGLDRTIAYFRES